MSREKENTCLEEFIAIYRSEPSPWPVKSKSYHDRGKKDAAYLKLVEKWKEVDPLCTKYDILKKINNLRSSFRKEAKKVNDSMRTGTGADEVYQPKLWYYDLLKFVEDQEVSRDSRSNISDDEHSRSENDSNDANKDSQDEGSRDQTQASTKTPSESEYQFRHRPTPKSSRAQGEQNNLITNEVLATVNSHFKQPRILDDRYDIFGKNVAMKLRDLSSEQRRLAEKFINDVLFEAEGESLTTFHKLTYQPSSQHSPISIYHPRNSFHTVYSPTNSTSAYSAGQVLDPLQQHLIKNNIKDKHFSLNHKQLIFNHWNHRHHLTNKQLHHFILSFPIINILINVLIL